MSYIQNHIQNEVNGSFLDPNSMLIKLGFLKLYMMIGIIKSG